MRWTFFAEFGWCGFGANRGLIPEARLGFVRIAYVGAGIGSLVDAIKAGVIQRRSA